jgi:hypothetical protein
MVACLATAPKFANATLTGLNSGSPARIMNIIESALEQHRTALAKAHETLDDLKELCTMVMQVLGYEN